MSFQKWEAQKPVQPTHGPAPAVKKKAPKKAKAKKPAKK